MKYICEAPARVPDATALSMMIPPVAQQPTPVVLIFVPRIPSLLIPAVLIFTLLILD
jgi:hypothetical protein